MVSGSTIPFQNAPCTGVKMCGEKGLSATGVQTAIILQNAKVVTFQALIQGTLITDIVIKIYGSLEGGQSAGDVLSTLNPTSVSKYVHVVDKAYDRLWVDCTTYTAAGKGSQVLMSAR
jgi:hypothetical protein